MLIVIVDSNFHVKIHHLTSHLCAFNFLFSLVNISMHRYLVIVFVEYHLGISLGLLGPVVNAALI